MQTQKAEFLSDPYNELLQESVRLSVGVERLDFHLLGFKTEYSLDAPPKPPQTPEQKDGAKKQESPNAQAKSEEEKPKEPEFKPNFKALSEKELVLFDDDKVFLDENLKIRQSYKIQIYQTSALQKTHKSPKIRLIENRDLSKLIAEIDFSGVSFYANIAMEVLQDIYKKMIKEGFFVGIRIFDFKKTLVEVLNRFKNKTLKHPKVLIEIATGTHPVSPESEKLIICYKDKASQDDDGIQKVSIIGINKGDLILRYIQPGTARKGRNLKLAFIEPHIPPENKIEFACSENLEAKEVCKLPERVHCVEYYAKKKGFVTRTPDGKFDIENELNLASATLKETGAILGGLDNNITVNIKSNSDLEDAVGSGVRIECENIIVNGNVGSNTILRAKSVKIYGNTNNSAKIYADNAYISKHKGYLKAKEVDIDTLENGNIDAQKVKIKKGLGGNVRAQKVLISSLGNNNTINFSEMALIEQCSGTNNKFTAQIIEEEETLKSLKAIEDRQRELPRLIEQFENAINSSKSGIDTLMKKIKNLQSQNMPVPANFMQMVREYKGYVSELARLNVQGNELKTQKEELIKRLRERDEELFDAKIINKGKSWQDMNVIKWKFSQAECSYMPRRGEEAVLFFAKRYFDNNEIQIQVANEFEEKDLEWLKQ